jgi:hypothetical protein
MAVNDRDSVLYRTWRFAAAIAQRFGLVWRTRPGSSGIGGASYARTSTRQDSSSFTVSKFWSGENCNSLEFSKLTELHSPTLARLELQVDVYMRSCSISPVNPSCLILCSNHGIY